MQDSAAVLETVSKDGHYLFFNATITKVMVAARRPAAASITVDRHQVEQVTKSKYLDSCKVADGDCAWEIKSRIGQRKKRFQDLRTIWRDKNITVDTKLRLLKVLVWPVLLYGSESWSVSRNCCMRIRALELWLYRQLLGVRWYHHRTNQSILQQLGMNYELMGRVALLKLSFFGHVVRGSSGDALRTVLEGRMEGVRPRGRPTECWMDNVVKWTVR
jgi:hypothetical protein